jgi:hypothetical protein
MKLLITFRDTENTVEDFVLSYTIRKCSLANEWVSLFIANFLKNDHPIEKTFCLHGWQTDYHSTKGRTVSYICQKLNHSINLVNQDLHSQGYEFIDLNFTVEAMKDPIVARNMLNEIHHHFELLIGQVWNPSKWYDMSQDHTKGAIRQLNNLCHELEAVLKCIADKPLDFNVNVGKNSSDFEGRMFADKQKKDISLENFNDFLEEAAWGDLLIYYAQLGKRHIEAFYDNDECIHDTNISGYKYITGEFVLGFHELSKHPLGFESWLKRKGYDINDKMLGLGYPTVAHLENQGSKWFITTELKKRDDLYKLTLLDDDGNMIGETIYDFTWKDQENLIK